MRRSFVLSLLWCACVTRVPDPKSSANGVTGSNNTTPDLTTTPSQSADVPAPSGSLPVSSATTHLQLSVDSTQERRNVSPYIYGVNQAAAGTAAAFVRAGGNRYTTYNWENNASNAGTDNSNSSDSYLSSSVTPGDAVQTRTQAAYARGAAMLLTVPIVDYVAADRSGPQSQPASATNTHWKKNVSDSAAPSTTPNAADDTVYQEEFVMWAEQTLRGQTFGLFYGLDNEPALWPSTHPLVHPDAPTYAEMKTRTLAFAAMIKRRAPSALVFGPVAYGLNEYENLQNASDAAGRNYLGFYLSEVASASAAAGKRLVDVLDLHWYTEAKAGSALVRDNYDTSPSDAIVDARLQAPRSLWDATYKENSWIANYYGEPVKLLTRLQETIAASYPGTFIAFTEYNYGGGNHVSGGLAEADVLGVFGKQGVFASNYWELQGDKNAFVYAAMNLYRNYDGQSSQVGEVSVKAASADVGQLSAYAFATSASSKLWIVAINKTRAPIALDLGITHTVALGRAQIVTLTSAMAAPQVQGTYATPGATFTVDVPALSALLIALAP
jgi:hypothetical protein